MKIKHIKYALRLVEKHPDADIVNGKILRQFYDEDEARSFLDKEFIDYSTTFSNSVLQNSMLSTRTTS